MDIHFDPKIKKALMQAREDASFPELALATGFEYIRKSGADLIEDADHHGWYRVMRSIIQSQRTA